MDETLSSNPSGIITLQCGHYSNFVGTHWWNIQNSSRKQAQRWQGPSQSLPSSSAISDPLFRESSDGGRLERVCTPRLVCIDLKGSLKTLNEDGKLYDDGTANHMGMETSHCAVGAGKFSSDMENNPSPRDTSVHCTELYKRNEYLDDVKQMQTDRNKHPQQSFEKLYNLDDVVDVWSDYLGTKYHHNSVQLLNQYMYNQDSSSFNSFNLGFSMNTDDKFWDSWEEKMHFFAEECDSLQGFQVMTDLDDGFGGLGTRIIENLRDLYGTKSIAVFGSWPGLPSSSINEQQQIMNSALSIGHLVEESSVLGLMSLQERLIGRNARQFPYINYKADLHYHTSAILASYLDSITQHYRIGSSSIAEFCNSITKTGHKIASTALALPLAAKTKSLAQIVSGLDCLYEQSVLQCLTPSQKASQSIYSHQIVIRGFPSIFEPNVSQNRRNRVIAEANAEIFEKYLYTKYSNSLTGMTFCENPLLTASPYPRYFEQRFKQNGFLQDPNPMHPVTNTTQTIVNSVPTLASLYTSNGMFDTLYDMIISVRKLNKSKIVVFEQSGIETDEIVENLEKLNNLAEKYDETQASKLL